MAELEDGEELENFAQEFDKIDISEMKAPAGMEKPKPQRPKVSKVESAARGFGQGVTWGMSDEITAGIESAFTQKTYKKSLAEARKALKTAQRDNPDWYTGTDIAGTVVRDVAITFIPGANFLRIASIGKGMAIGAADSALEALGKSDDKLSVQAAKKVAEGALFGAAAFGAVGGIAKGIKKAQALVKSVDPKSTAMMQEINFSALQQGHLPTQKDLNSQAEFFKEEGLNLWNEATRIAQRTPAKETKKLLAGPQNWPQDFKEWKLLKSAGQKISAEEDDHLVALWKGQGEAEQKDMVKNYLFGRGLRKAYAKTLATADGKTYVAGLSDPFEHLAIAKMRAPSQNAALLDFKIGGNMEGVVSSVSRAQENVTLSTAPFLVRQHKLVKQAKKANLSNETIRDGLMGTLETPLNKEQQDIIGGFRSWFEDARKSLIKDGLNINHQTDYLSRMSMNMVDTRVVMQRKWDKIKAGKATPEEGQEFAATSKYLWPDLPDKFSEPELLKKIKGLTDSGSEPRGNIPEAFATFSRKEGTIPSALVETEVDKIMSNYILMNYRALHMRAPMENLQSYIRLFNGMEMPKTSQIWEDYFRQLTSTPGGYQSVLAGTQAKLKITGDRMMEEGGLTGAAGKVVKEGYDFSNWMVSQIYPNYLGMNLHAPIRNMAQTWMLTAPELKGAYGYGVVRRAWFSAAKAKAKGENFEKFLQDKGLIGADFNNEGLVNTLAEGLGPLGPLGQAIDWVGKKGLWLYSKSDSANRYLTWHAAQEVSGDLLKKTPESMRFLKSMNTGPRLVIERALAEGNEEAVSSQVTTYLLDKTQFKYTRGDLSQFAREYGRIFSMFTKWPVMVIGDIERSIKIRQGLDKILEPMQKYGTPMLLLQGIQAFVDDSGGIDPKLQLFLGRDISKWSPFSAVTGLQAPPLLQIPAATFSALKHASEGEIKKAAKELGRVGEPFIPALYLKKLTERVQEGIK